MKEVMVGIKKLLVTEDGRIFDGNKEKTYFPSRNGRYVCISVWDGKRCVTRSVHRLVAEAYIGSVVDKMVCHKDDNPKNNHKDNLFIGTNSDNMIDAANKNRLPLCRKRISDDERKNINSFGKEVSARWIHDNVHPDVSLAQIWRIRTCDRFTGEINKQRSEKYWKRVMGNRSISKVCLICGKKFTKGRLSIKDFQKRKACSFTCGIAFREKNRNK